MKPFIPIPFRQGNKIIRKYIEPLDDGAGHVAIVTKIDYRDKKGKRVNGFVMFVKWEDSL